MASGSKGIWGSSATGADTAYKRLRFISGEYMAYVEIKMVATAIDERQVEYNYSQKDITRAVVDLPLKQGDIRLTTWQRNLGIDFDFAQTETGYEVSFYWATFGDDNSTKMYHIDDRMTFSLPLGTSSIKNRTAEYSVFPEPQEGQKIFLHIKEAYIHIRSFSGHYDLSLKKHYDKIFDNEKTINIESVFRDPRNHLGY